MYMNKSVTTPRLTKLIVRRFTVSALTQLAATGADVDNVSALTLTTALVYAMHSLLMQRLAKDNSVHGIRLIDKLDSHWQHLPRAAQFSVCALHAMTTCSYDSDRHSFLYNVNAAMDCIAGTAGKLHVSFASSHSFSRVLLDLPSP
jgi:hypothetical protein